MLASGRVRTIIMSIMEETMDDCAHDDHDCDEALRRLVAGQRAVEEAWRAYLAPPQPSRRRGRPVSPAAVGRLRSRRERLRQAWLALLPGAGWYCAPGAACALRRQAQEARAAREAAASDASDAGVVS
jgi:hypothetical protein